MLKRLDLFVESDYSVVLFNAGVINQPNFTWLVKVYNALDRK
jgi:hypothetical protein